MSRTRGKVLFLILFVLLVQVVAAWAYVEPTKSILPAIEKVELYNPDLPNRTGGHFGEIVGHAAASETLIFDPNIYLSNQDETYDLINLLEASVGVDIPLQEHKIQLDYLAQQYLFSRFSSNNHFDQRVRGLLELNFPEFRVTLKDVYKKYETLPGSDNTARLKQDDNAMRVGIAHETGKFAISAGYSNLVHNYNNTDPIFGSVTYKDRSYMMHVADISLGYKILPKTSLIVENDYGYADFKGESSPNYYFDDILFGVRGEMHKNLSITLLGGYRYQHFDASPVFYDDTVSQFVCRGGIRYSFSDRDIFYLDLQRTVNDSTYQNVTYFTTNFVGLYYTHIFTDKISSRIFASYQRNVYPTETTEGAKTAKRKDNAYGAGVSLRYDIRRWLSAEAGYEFKKADGNFRQFNYTDNIATLKLSAGF